MEKSDSSISSSEKPAGSLLPKPSGIKPPSTIPKATARQCCSHERKPDLPAAATPSKASNPKSIDKMPRQTEEFKTHHLPDLTEESEYELWSDRFGSWIGRSSKSRSPDSMKHLRYDRYDRKSSSGVSSTSPDFYEATGRRSSSDHGNDLTTDTDSFMIGQRVFVGGFRPGRITFIGEVHFAPGEWAGIVLDEPEGKNDGAVSGKRYFQCEPKKGIFSRLTRLTREPLTSATTPDGTSSMDTSFRSMTSPARSGTTSPTYSVTSVSKTTTYATKPSDVPEINDRVIVKSGTTGSKVGILRYKGEPQFASGIWCGVELIDSEGKNDGSISGHRYFKCEPNRGLFVPLNKVSLSPISRKSRLSRANSQESLASNLTLGSLASTNTSKLRLTATQKRLSSLNKTPSAMSTPKPSYSLQDILREKTNHIEQLMKEREQDRDEMTASSVLFQKNINLHRDKISKLSTLLNEERDSFRKYKEKVAILTTQLEEEKKKSEDLLFNIEESKISAEETDSSLLKYKDRIAQLENEIKTGRVQAGGDFVPAVDPAHLEELGKLRKELDEATTQLKVTEELKKSFENEIQSLHGKLAELKNDLDMKTSGAMASEECLRDQLNNQEKRMNELEVEIGERDLTIGCLKVDIDQAELIKVEAVAQLQGELKKLAEALTSGEALLKEQLTSKDTTIEQLNMEIVELQGKEANILRLNEKETLLNERIQQLEKELRENSESLIKNGLEMTSLQNAFSLVESEYQNLQQSSEKQLEDINQKAESNKQLQIKFDEQGNQISVMKLKLERFQSSIQDSDASVQKSHQIEENLKRQISELLESKEKLENEIAYKEAQFKESELSRNDLEREISERGKCMAGLEAEVESLRRVIDEKEATIVQNLMEYREFKDKNDQSMRDLNDSGQTLAADFAAVKQSMTEEFEKEKAEHTAEKKSLTSKIDDLNKTVKEKESQLDKSEKNVSLLTELKTSLDEKLSARESELSDLTSKCNKLERDDAEKASQVEKLQKSLEDVSKKLSEAEFTSKNLQDDKHVLEVDKNDLNRKLGASEEKIAQLAEQKSKLQQDLETAKSSSMDVNSELSKMNGELREKQAAFEAFQNEAETAKLSLERRVDELERQKGLMEQQCSKLKDDIDALQTQKIESENQLNQELQNIKVTSDEEKSELGREINKIRSTFESEKNQLSRDKKEVEETLDRLREEMEHKIRDLQSTITALELELENAKKLSKESQSSMGGVVDELKKKESELTEELNNQRAHSDDLKKSLEALQTSKDILKDEYEEKLLLHKNKIAKIEDDLKAVQEQQKMASAGTEEKIKILDDLQAKCYDQEQKLTDLTHQLENEVQLKKKLELSIQDSQAKFKELEDEQVDLVNREEVLKVERESLQREIEQMQQLHKSLDEKIALERKDSEHFKIVSDERINMLEQKIRNLGEAMAEKDQDKDVVVEKLHLREEEIVKLQSAIKDLESKLEAEVEETHKLLKGKDDELLKFVHESTSKDSLIADLTNNLDNIQSCLKSTSTENESTTMLVQKLNQDVSGRDAEIRELKMKVYSIEKINKEIEDQMKNIVEAKEQKANQSQSRIDDLMEQIALMEEVKEREVSEMASELSLLRSKMSIFESTTESSTSNLKVYQMRESELMLTIKDLELKEAELELLTSALKRRNDELETMKGVPRSGDAYDLEMQSHIDFLKEIISDMDKKNRKLTSQVELLLSGASTSDTTANGLDLNFLKKKKPAPRLYCDICEEFDAHDTEDCPTQSSEMDHPPPTPKDGKEKKKPPPRVFCDHCDCFDLHETEDCPHGADETF